MGQTYSRKIYEGAGSPVDLVIPEGYTDIGILTFCKVREKLKSVVFPSTMTTLPEKLFKDCSLLQSVDLGNCNASVIPKSFFSGCKELNDVTLPRCLTEIGEEAFYDCCSFQNISIPENVTKIGKRAFHHCGSLQNIKIPDSVKTIDDYAFNYCRSLQNILIPDSVTKIGVEAFNNCNSLQSVKLPKGLKTISGGVFSCCNKLLSITIPDSVTVIGGNAFLFCNFQSITIPDGITKIGVGAFGYCKCLDNVIIPKGVTKIEKGTFEFCSALQNISIPDSVTEIGMEAFRGCKSLKSISIPDGVKGIDYRTFYECESLKDVNIPKSVTLIGEEAFSECYSLKSFTLPEGLTTIGERAFQSCSSLQSINIPDSVTEMGTRVFYGCNLDDFEIESVNFRLTGGMLIDKTKAKVISSAFTYITDVVIPEGITVIGEKAFEECESLQNVIISESVTLIGHCAFYKCRSLKSVVIPGGVTDIDRSAFYDCDSLTCVTITSPNTKLYGYTFGSCSSLRTVNLPKGLSWTRIKDSFEGSPWGEMSPKAAQAAQKEAEEAAKKEALQVKEGKVRAMSSMAASFVIKQAIEVALKAETGVTPDAGHQWYDISSELSDSISLKIRMAVVLDLQKVQAYTSKLVEKLSKIKTVFDEVFVGQVPESSLISISIPDYDSNQAVSSKIRMDINQACTKAGNHISFQLDKADIDYFLSMIDAFSELIKQIDGFTEINGDYELKFNEETLDATIKSAVSAYPQVKVPPFITGLSADSFKGCDKLIEISIPKTAEVSGWPFGDCINLKNINLY